MVNASKSIGVVDYGSGNLRSVSKALEAVGASVALVTSSAQLDPLDAVVVPGVGAFGDCAQNLRKSGLWEPLIEWLQAGRPYLGICLGYQLLFESSEESPGCKGLGVLPGRVVRFQGKRLKVPHIGWNVLLDMRGPMFKTLCLGALLLLRAFVFPCPGRRCHRQRALRIRGNLRRQRKQRQPACDTIPPREKSVRRAHIAEKLSGYTAVAGALPHILSYAVAPCH